MAIIEEAVVICLMSHFLVLAEQKRKVDSLIWSGGLLTDLAEGLEHHMVVFIEGRQAPCF